MAEVVSHDPIAGFEAPVHRALTEPILLAGAPRAVAILNGTVSAAIGLGLRLWVAGLVLWALGHMAAVWAAKRDPLFVEVVRRHVFAATSTRGRPAAAVSPLEDQKTATPTGQADAPPFDPESLLNMQDRKSAFLNGPVDRKTVSSDRLENPASRYVVQAGAVIPAALITGIRSDLPGEVTAQVTENVYDSPSGRFLLIPQGSKLVGVYDSQISFGQDRVLLVWTRLIMPNGRSIVLERQPGADTQGFTGLEDEVDQHWGRLAMAAALSTVLGVGAELGATNNDSAIVTALRRGSTDSLNQTGQQVVRRNLNIQPTITIRPGFPVRVIVNRDLVLAPYQS